MAEIKREPYFLNPGDKQLTIFDEYHTLSDILRYLLSTGTTKEELIFLLEKES